MSTQWRSSRPSTRSGFGCPASATSRSTSSTIALTWRSLGADAMTNSSATTNTSPTSRITTSRAPFESAARAASVARFRACARSLVRFAVLPPDQITGVVAQDNGHIDLVVVRHRPVRRGGALLDPRTPERRRQPQRLVPVLGAPVEHQGLVLAERGGVPGNGDLGASPDQNLGGGSGQIAVGGAVEQADTDPSARGRRHRIGNGAPQQLRGPLAVQGVGLGPS